MISTEEFLKMFEAANRWNHDINYRVNPLKYEVSDDCGGMYTCEPYKSRLLQIWKFSTPESARFSARSIKDAFFEYLDKGDFVGADLARKYLKAGFTRVSIPAKSKKYFAKAYKKIRDNKNYNLLRDAFIKSKEQEQSEHGER